MGLKGDIDEVKDIWGNSSWLTKSWLGLSCFLSVSSITSLSDIVVKWKGFILDGIEFYRSWVLAPVLEILELFNLQLSVAHVDLLVIKLLLITCMLRGFWFLDIGYFKLRIIRYTLLAITVFGLSYYLYDSSGVINSPDYQTIVPAILLALFMPYIVRELNKVVYYFPIVFSVITLLFLGAINAGLSA